MMSKLILAAAVVAGSLTLGASSSQADDCHYRRGHHHHHSRHHGYRGRYGYGYRPSVSISSRYYGVYRPPVGVYSRSVYRSYRPYGRGYIGPGLRYGYGGFPYSGRGLSIGIGF
jgi:hypothetical protein